jgi:hypothetical protein
MTIPFFFAFLFLFYLLVLLQTTWMTEIFPPFLKPDPMLIFVVFVGTRPHLISGAALVGVCALLYGLFSGIQGGLMMIVYFIFFFLLQALTRVILIGDALSFRLLLVFGALLLQALLTGLLPFVLGVVPAVVFPPGGWVLAQAAATSLLAWPLWILFRKVESLPRMTPAPKSE